MCPKNTRSFSKYLLNAHCKPRCDLVSTYVVNVYCMLGAGASKNQVSVLVRETISKKIKVYVDSVR